MAPLPAGFAEGTPDLQSAGALTFGPDGVLFVGDSRGGAVFALAVQDPTPDPHKGEVEIDDIDKRIAKALGTTPDQVVIRDMAVNPATQHMFFSVSRGRGSDARPAIVRSTLTGELSRRSARRRALLEAGSDRRPDRDGEDAVGRQLAVDGDHRSRLHRRRAPHRRPLERGVCLDAAPREVSLHRGIARHDARDLPHVARQATRPRRRSRRSCPTR